MNWLDAGTQLFQPTKKPYDLINKMFEVITESLASTEEWVTLLKL